MKTSIQARRATEYTRKVRALTAKKQDSNNKKQNKMQTNVFLGTVMSQSDLIRIKIEVEVEVW